METAPGPASALEHEPEPREREEPGSTPGDDAARRGGYLGFVAHEVRNPLSTALWSAELLVRMPAAERGGARGEKLSAMCLRSLARVRQLVEDHLLCERLDAQGLPIRPEQVDLGELLAAAGSRLSAGQAAPELRLDGARVVDADRGLLERAFDALLALAGREGAPVVVEGGTRGGLVRLVFRGHPATAEVLADPRKGSPGDPRGRALAGPLARRAAEALGGSLAVEGGALVLTVPATPRA